MPVKKVVSPKKSPKKEKVTSPKKSPTKSPKKQALSKKEPFDPLNSASKGTNPLTGKRYTASFKNYVKQWENLPVYKYSYQFLDLFDSNDVVILKSGTGSGKSVIIPKLVAHYFEYSKKVVMTTPKQITTQSAAEYSAKTLDSPLGEKIGYTFKGSAREFYNAEKSIIEYTTDGKLITKFFHDMDVSSLDAIIIDEAHERKVNIDILLFFIRSAMITRKNKKKSPLKLVIMSATIDESIFKNYFTSQDFTVGVIEIPGASYFEVEDVWSEKVIKPEMFIPEVVNLVKHIHSDKKFGQGDILVFVTGKKQAEDICVKVASLQDLYCKELYSGLSTEDKELATSKDKYKLLYPNKTRKLVIATDVAESSITVDGIKFVIDNGMAFKTYYNPETRFVEGRAGFVTKAQIQQRKGRTGRTGPGICFHLYTKAQYDELRAYPDPEIKVVDLTENTLSYLSLFKTRNNLENLYENLLEPPSKKVVEASIDTLVDLGVINKSFNLTAFGIEVYDVDRNITNDVFLSCIYVNAVKEGCLKEVIIILEGYRYYSKNRKLFKDYSKTKFDDTIGDLKELYNFFFVNNLYDESNIGFHRLVDAFNISDHSVFTVKEDMMIADGENVLKNAVRSAFCKSFENFEERKCKMNKNKEFKVKRDKVNFNNRSLTYRTFEQLSKAKHFVFLDRSNGSIDFVVPC